MKSILMGTCKNVVFLSRWYLYVGGLWCRFNCICISHRTLSVCVLLLILLCRLPVLLRAAGATFYFSEVSLTTEI